MVALAALLQAAFLLLGGAVADIWRSRRLLQVALGGLVVAAIGATFFSDGQGVVVSRIVAWASGRLIIPFTVGMVAVVYRGPDQRERLDFRTLGAEDRDQERRQCGRRAEDREQEAQRGRSLRLPAPHRRRGVP